MEKMKKYVFCAFLLSLCLNTYGIWWAGPSQERIKLVFSDRAMVEKLSPAMLQSMDDIYQGIEYYDQPQNYKDYDISIDNAKPLTVKRSLLDGARSFLLRSYAPDEQATLKAISNMDPSRFNFNPRFFIYGGLYLYIISIFLKIVSLTGTIKLISDVSYYFLNPGQIGLMFTYGKLVSAVFVSCSVFYIYLCGEVLFNKRTGLIASFLFAVTPAIVIWSHYLNPHAFTIFWMMLSLFTGFKIYKHENRKAYIYSGFTSGITAGSLLIYGLILFALPLIQFTKNIEKGFKKAIISLFDKNMWFALGAFIFGFIAVNPYWLVSIKQVFREFHMASTYWQFSPSFANISYYARHVIMYGLGFPLWFIAILGLLFVFHNHRKKDVLLIILLLTPLIYFAFSTTRHMHYGLFIYPFLVLLGARFLDWFISGKKVKKISGLIVLFAVFIYTFAYSLSMDVAAGRKNTKTSAGEWINSNIPPGSSVGLLDMPSPWRTPPFNFFKYEIVNIYWDKTLLENYEPLYVVVTEYQWLRGKDYGQLKEYLKDYIELRRFEEYPRILGMSFRRDGSSPWDWADINPEVIVFIRRGTDGA